MSVEEDVELRDLVVETLEINGVLPKIRAQLRANLFLALDEDSKISKQHPLENKKIKSEVEGPEGQLMFCLVREFLEYFDLNCTISVYEPESYIGSCYKYEGRDKIIEELGLKTNGEAAGPILLQLLKVAQQKLKTIEINLSNLNGDNVQNGDSSLSSDVEAPETSALATNETFNGAVEERSGVGDGKLGEAPVCDATFVKPPENDDTFNGTSSIEEEEHPDKQSSSQDSSSPESRSLKGPKTPKNKLEQSRDILPSLYSKNKEFDFDIKDDYEEDFITGSELSKVEDQSEIGTEPNLSVET